jgi:hypothetical protein
VAVILWSNLPAVSTEIFSLHSNSFRYATIISS